MSARVVEASLVDVVCDECGWSHPDPVQRSEGERLADTHDELWHAPVFDDELVQS